jgi:hypothetical protein
MMSAYVSNSVAIFTKAEKYIDGYTSTTSDHLPIMGRFRIKNDQVISLSSPAVKTYGEPSFELSGFASSSLPLTYKSSDTAVVTITDNKVEIVGAGTANITASQDGDSIYFRAKDVQIQLVVEKAAQTLFITPVDEKTIGGVPFTVNAVSTSALPIDFSTISDKIVITGNHVTIAKPGRVIITATQSGNSNYEHASATTDFCIRPSAPTVTISPVAAATLVSTAATGNQWYFNGLVLAGATETTLMATRSGIYSVKSKFDDCISDFSNEVAMAVTGNIDLDKKTLLLTPNPVNDYIEIFGIDEHVERAHIFDVSGRRAEIELEKHDSALRGTVESLAPGMYWLAVNHHGALFFLRFVKE